MRRPRSVYELEDLNGKPVDGLFYREELNPVRIMDRTIYKIDKVPNKSVRRGICEYLVRWRGYRQDFNLWMTATSVKNIECGDDEPLS